MACHWAGGRAIRSGLDRLGGTAARNGIEIAVPENTPVHAVHGGTVGLAGPFVGFGNLVILEHGGNNYSLCGYLGTVGVEPGTAVAAGGEARPQRRGPCRAANPVF